MVSEEEYLKAIEDVKPLLAIINQYVLENKKEIEAQFGPYPKDEGEK